jgi:3-methyladenine DNA glycosylase/8-oxoguanine DNA glycosylase
VAPEGVVTEVTPIVALDLRATLRPLTLAWGRFDPQGWWRAFRTPDGPATLRINRQGAVVRGETWGAGAEWVAGRLPDLIGLRDDPESFQPHHGPLARLHRRHAGNRFGSTGLVVEALVFAIVGQKVTGAEAAEGLRGLTRAFSEAAPGPTSLRLPPDPVQMAAAPYHAYHPLGIERRRADLLKLVATRAVRLEELAGQDPLSARSALEALPGVGPWTSAEAVTISHGDPDAVSVGDFHLKHQVSWHLAGEPRGTDERMLELLEPYRPHRGRVVRLLEQAGPYPRYGPRQPVRDIGAI